jgi:hypothetical protein
MPKGLLEYRVREATCLTGLRETSLFGGCVNVGKGTEAGGGGARDERAQT